MTIPFIEFPKIARFSREVVITEKLDGTNAQIYIYKEVDGAGYECEDYSIKAGSRTRWITPEDDNYGFAKWVETHKEELVAGLGEGSHFGEWWGQGIQRNYGLKEKRFSLFNTHRWADDNVRPKCCDVVPVLYRGVCENKAIERCIEDLGAKGSTAAPGFMKPEGIVIFHTAANMMFKKTLYKDDEYKGKSGLWPNNRAEIYLDGCA